MNRILLMSLPFYRLMGSHYNGMNLGISYIAAVLKSRKYHVGLYNADYFDSSQYSNQDQIFNGYDDYMKIIQDAKHPLWEEVVDNILGWEPDYIGISMYTANYPSAKIISRKIRERNPEIKIVIGGVHPSLAYKDLLKEKWFDFLIRGEGEFALLELLNNVPHEKITGLSFFDKKGKPVHNESRKQINPLDIVPFPERDLFITPSHNMNLGQIITGRGCPFACTYCASPSMWGRTNVRFRSVYDVATELELLSKKYQSSMIYISDDTFTLKKQRTIDLCDEILRRRLNITWKCDTRADCLDDELLSKMKKAGCELVKIGIESGSEKILKQIRKGENKDKFKKAVEIIRRHNIKVTGYLMVGFPGETDEDVQQTVDFANELALDYYSLSVMAPYYGTEIYDTVGEYGIELEKDHWEYFYHQSKVLSGNNTISPEMVNRFLAINQNKDRI